MIGKIVKEMKWVIRTSANQSSFCVASVVLW